MAAPPPKSDSPAFPAAPLAASRGSSNPPPPAAAPAAPAKTASEPPPGQAPPAGGQPRPAGGPPSPASAGATGTSAGEAVAPVEGGGWRELTLFLIRHAESEANVRDRPEYAGRSEESFANTRLTENGRLQAAKVQGPVDLLIVSPLRRTLETYTCSRLHARTVLVDPLVREFRAYGRSCEMELETPLVETAQQLRDRVRTFIRLLCARPERDIGVLSHGVFLAELAAALGRPFKCSMLNAEVRRFDHVRLPVPAPPPAAPQGPAPALPPMPPPPAPPTAVPAPAAAPPAG